MPIFLVIVGLLLIVTGVRGKASDFLGQVADDGKGFVPFFFLILAIGATGFSKTLRPVSNAFLVLVIVAFVLKSGGAIIDGFKQIQNGS